MASDNLVLELESIRKRYGHVSALEGVTLIVRRGEILTLLGDNGAGKSTLVKVISGRVRPDAGIIRFAGTRVQMRSPADSRDLGIETVYQDLALIDCLPIWRNFYLGKEELQGPRRLGQLARSRMRSTCMEALGKIRVTRNLSPDTLVGSLSGGQRQAVSIARAMHFDVKLLVMDEPTAALGAKAAEAVYEGMKFARSQGVAVLVISHNIRDMHAVADRAAIMQMGRIVTEYECEAVELADLVRELVARDVGVVA